MYLINLVKKDKYFKVINEQVSKVLFSEYFILYKSVWNTFLVNIIIF